MFPYTHLRSLFSVPLALIRPGFLYPLPERFRNHNIYVCLFNIHCSLYLGRLYHFPFTPELTCLNPPGPFILLIIIPSSMRCRHRDIYVCLLNIHLSSYLCPHYRFPRTPELPRRNSSRPTSLTFTFWFSHPLHHTSDDIYVCLLKVHYPSCLGRSLCPHLGSLFTFSLALNQSTFTLSSRIFCITLSMIFRFVYWKSTILPIWLLLSALTYSYSVFLCFTTFKFYILVSFASHF